MLKYCAASAIPVPLLLALLLLAGFGSVPVVAADSGQTAPVAATPEVAPSASAPTTPDADEPSDDAAPDTAGNEGGDAENAAVVDRLLEVSRGRTLIAVTHDDRLAPRFDHVLDMESLSRAEVIARV